MTCHTAVGIDNDLTSGQTGVTLRAADNKTAGRIDIVFGIIVQHFCRYDRFNNMLHNISADLLHRNFRRMLRRNDYSVDTYGLTVVVFNCNLSFAIRTQIR